MRWLSACHHCTPSGATTHCKKRAKALPVIGFTLSRRASYAPSGVKLPPLHDIATQTSPLHVGDAEHVVTTAAVVTMVFLVKGIVKDITVGSSTGKECKTAPNGIDVEMEPMLFSNVCSS